MKKEVKLLLERSINSLILSIEHFNRPWDRGRIETVLILLDHSFEILLKASILHDGGKIREKGHSETFGFDKCVRTAISRKIITKEQALTLQTINSLRDAAQHYILELSENQLYLHSQAGLTLFKDILNKSFGKDLVEELPKRVLPISTTPPVDIDTLFENEIDEIKKLLKPKSRKKTEAVSKLRGLAIFDKTLMGDNLQPSENYLNKLADQLKKGIDWQTLFPGVSSISISSQGSGTEFSLRIDKKEGAPIRLVPEGTPGATVVAVKRVNELSYYNLFPTDLAKKLKISIHKLAVIVDYLKIKEDPACYRVFKVAKSTTTQKYFPKALKILKEELPKLDVDAIWEENKPEHYKNMGKRKNEKVKRRRSRTGSP